MAIISNFTFSAIGREVTFTDHSTGGNIVSYEWDFGDGNSSTDQNPVYTYDVDGYYTVTLKVTNTIPDDSTSSRYLGVSTFGPMLSQSIATLVANYAPVGITFPSGDIQSLTQKWQEYLSILVTPNILPVNTFNEFAWPALVNQLIVELIAYDLLMQGANQFMLAAGQTGSSTTGGQLKKVTTGPSDAEWFGNADMGDIWKDVMKPGGAIDQLKAQICMLSARLRIWLPICPKLSFSPIIPEKHIPPSTTSNDANPFGIMPPLP